MLPFARMVKYANKMKVPEVKEIFMYNGYSASVIPSTALLLLYKNGDLMGIGGTTSQNYGFGNGVHNAKVKEWTLIYQNVKRFRTAQGSFNLIQTEDNKFYYSGVGKAIGAGLSTASTYTDCTSYFTSVFNATQLSQIKDIQIVGEGIFVLLENGTLYGMGANTQGYFGNNTTTRLSTFTSINTNVDSVKTGSSAVIVQKIDKTLWVSGQNTWGSLGISNDATNIRVWTKMGAFANNTVIHYELGGSASWVVYKHNTNNTYTVRASGIQSDGNLGNGSAASSGTVLSTISTLPISDDMIMKSNSLTYGGLTVKTANSLYMCGINTYGRLGLGNKTSSTTFVTPVDAPKVASIELFCPSECTNVYMDNQGDVYLSGYIPQATGTTVSDYYTKFQLYKIPSRGI